MQAVVEQPPIAPPRLGARERAAYLDNLKAALVAAIIAVHGIVGYSSWEGAWAYEPAAEVRLAPVTENVLGSLVLPAVLFAMGLFFLMSGLVTPGSLLRKGPRRFARDRPVRLGIPLAVWALGAFILQGPVLIGVALALRPVDVPAEITALTVACAGVAVSFAVASLLVSRTKLGRIL